MRSQGGERGACLYKKSRTLQRVGSVSCPCIILHSGILGLTALKRFSLSVQGFPLRQKKIYMLMIVDIFICVVWCVYIIVIFLIDYIKCYDYYSTCFRSKLLLFSAHIETSI